MILDTIKFIMIAFILTGCAGYRVKKGPNSLFFNENIRSIAVPMFINKTSFPHVSAPMTREVVKELAQVQGLTVHSGEDSSADAMLIGIITSPKREAELIRTTAPRFTDGSLETSIGDRAGFFIPVASTYIITVRYFLIKKPTQLEREVFSSDEVGKLDQAVAVNPKVVFNKRLALRGNFNREIANTITSDSGGIVNYTKTKKYFEQSVNKVAMRAARNLRELILNVF